MNPWAGHHPQLPVGDVQRTRGVVPAAVARGGEDRDDLTALAEAQSLLGEEARPPRRQPAGK